MRISIPTPQINRTQAIKALEQINTWMMQALTILGWVLLFAVCYSFYMWFLANTNIYRCEACIHSTYSGCMCVDTRGHWYR
jgi:hypothetical protein